LIEKLLKIGSPELNKSGAQLRKRKKKGEKRVKGVHKKEKEREIE
jgi:hypothetical protein